MRVVVGVAIFVLTGCGLTLSIDPPAEDTGGTGSDGAMDAGRRDAAPGDSDGPDGGMSDTGGSPDAPTTDAGPRDTSRPDGLVVVDAVMPIDGGAPCGSDPLWITTEPSLVTIGFLEFSYDADSNATTTETWSLPFAPTGMTIDAMGVVRWGVPVRGTHAVAVEVRDRCMGSDTQYFDLTVTGGAINGLAPDAISESALSTPEVMQQLASAPIHRSVTLAPIVEALEDPRSLSLLGALARCALAPRDTLRVAIRGEERVLIGEMGLAPEWREGGCGEACRRWVSACALSLVNPVGARVPISYVPSTGHQREGAYEGDLFADPPVAHACRGEAPAAWLGSRTCVDGDRRCPAPARESCGELPARAIEVWLAPPTNGDSNAPAPFAGRSAAP